MDAAAVRRPDDHRHAVAVVRAIAHPGRLGHDLVERREDEVGELDLAHRPQPVDRRADRRADDHRLGQRRIDDPVVAELAPQPVRRQEHAALLADVLAQHDDRLVPAHLVGERLRIASMNVRATIRPGLRQGRRLRVDVAHRRGRIRIRLRLGVLGRVVDGGLDLGGQPASDASSSTPASRSWSRNVGSGSRARSAASSSSLRYFVCWSSDECAVSRRTLASIRVGPSPGRGPRRPARPRSRPGRLRRRRSPRGCRSRPPDRPRWSRRPGGPAGR